MIRIFVLLLVTLSTFAAQIGTNSVLLSATIPTIFVTDPAYGAVGDYNGTQGTAGTGTDSRVAIQSALDAAYTQGSGGAGDTTGGNSYRVVIPKGKYYISARSDGLPSLTVPLKVEFDFSEAELHFDRPPTNNFGNGILEPNPLWCAIKGGQMSGIRLGKMQMKPNQDLTYGGTWYGLNLDAIRIQEADICWISGEGREHYILGFTRGAGIRFIACWNAFVKDINFSSDAFGIIMSYYGTAFNGYTRYRGTSQAESVSVALRINNCSFLNIFKKGVYVGVNGDYHTPAGGGFENVTFDRLANGGPISFEQCSFESIAEECINVTSQSVLLIHDIRMEEIGCVNTLATIYSSSVRSFKLDGVTWQASGTRSIFKASYTGPLTSSIVNPDTFVRVDATDVAPVLENIYINNQASTDCMLVNGGANITRLPIVSAYKTETGTMMQRTASYMQSMVIPNDGGRIWSPSTVGISPQESVNGSNTTFTFLNGFKRQIPNRVQIDGAMLNGTNKSGTVNWTWDATNTRISTTTAPTKDVRAFY